jgi:hypothetical protein
MPFLVPTKKVCGDPASRASSSFRPNKKSSTCRLSPTSPPIEDTRSSHSSPFLSSLPLDYSDEVVRITPTLPPSQVHNQSTVQYPQNPILHAVTRPPSATASLRAWHLASPSATLELPGPQRSPRALPVTSSTVNARAPQTTDHRPNGGEILARYVAFGPSLSVCWSQISRFENAVDPCCLSTSSSAAKRSAEIWGDWDWSSFHENTPLPR